MTSRKSERLVNLLIALLSTRRFITRNELRIIVEGYRDSSESAFERQFERDKEELRSLGIIVETGSNDVFFDDEEGYRINRSDFELPELSFTAAELSALALAGQVWQDSVAADHTARAFEALQAGGAAPDPSLLPTVQPRLSIVEPDFDTIYEAVLRRRVITFGYGGKTRRVEPWRLLQRRGRWYVFGLDQERQADRFFKLARFTSPATTVGKAGAFEVPDDADVLAQRLVPVNDATALVALRGGAVESFADRAEETWRGDVPPGFTVYRVALATAEAIVGECAAAGPDAILLEPEELRGRLVEHLSGLIA